MTHDSGDVGRRPTGPPAAVDADHGISARATPPFPPIPAAVSPSSSPSPLPPSLPPPSPPPVTNPDDEDGTDASLNDAEKLPYSKWRCIALVATVTGASFVNVTLFLQPELSLMFTVRVAPEHTCSHNSQTLSGQSVVIILPSIGRDLHIPDSRQQWIVSAYALTFGCFLLLWGRIADVFGKKAIFVAGSAWVTATTIANPFVPNEIAFDLFRGLQGLGAAANVPTAIGILGTTFPPGKAKNYAFATYGAGAPLGSIFGNLLSGIITSYATWKWVFGMLAILAGIVTLAGALVIPDQPPLPPPPSQPAAVVAGAPISPVVVAPKATLWSIDWLGGFIVTLGLVILLFALTEGNVVGWSTPWIGVLIGLSVLHIVVFVLYQIWLESPGNLRRRQHHLQTGAGAGVAVAASAWPPPPLVRMSLFTHARPGSSPLLFATALVIMALFFASFNNYLVYATYFYQDYQGLSAIQTTLRFIPTGIAGVLTSFVVARVLHRVPAYLILLFGHASVSISSLLLAVPIPVDRTSYFAYGFEAMVLSVFGADTAWPSLTLFVSRALPPEDQALGGALVNMAGQVGRAIGLAIATAVQTVVMASDRGVSVAAAGPMAAHDPATLRGLRAGSWFNFALGVVSMLIVLIAFRGAGIVGNVPTKSPPGPLRAVAAASAVDANAAPVATVQVQAQSPVSSGMGSSDDVEPAFGHHHDAEKDAQTIVSARENEKPA
ncbi:major facilitator superfamily MFS-1 [Niveomyces insectorum RCEF 264]|uniref:Major facilitator superfamily MFS-1 n=1 Tax=Niveomyces insectorum RCEF 264 TaxID=1081102 RepID=A0A167XWZ8_9HYPO|nr:major facilitator superfamily MFS-1 [Niveomyces insectorum RCEF 264]